MSKITDIVMRIQNELRKEGITIRKSVDNWIATFCIENKLPLLFSDKDFYPFVEHLSLRTP